MAKTTVVSSPGKVLIAGGYLVLDPAFSGTVVSTSSRFYTVVQDVLSKGPGVLTVHSPQFLDAKWKYDISQDAPFVVEPSPENTSKNKFVHLALQSTIALASEIKGAAAVQEALSSGLNISIVGDNDFYSQRAKLASLNLPRTLEFLAHIPPFSPIGVPLSEVHKTGLGSSAALITSLVTALLIHLSAITDASISKGENAGRRLAHNLSQYVHCLAQGKIGSGFDVSAAVFGSHIYTRFDPAVLHNLMNNDNVQPQSLLPTLSPSNSAWNYRIQPFVLPPLTRIILADVDAGSDTPSLVGKVLKWRKEKKEEADTLWNELDKLNQALGQKLLHLSSLHSLDPENYSSAVKYISSLQSLQWNANPFQPEAEVPVIAAFVEVHDITQAIRVKMQKMGNCSDVPIEPAEQTTLIDVCVNQAGVIGGGVPGAGGYDAIWLLVCDHPDCSHQEQPLERVQHLWSIYKELDVSPLLATESKAKGLQIEDLDKIPGLKSAVTSK